MAGQLYGTASHMLELKWTPVMEGTVVAKRIWYCLSCELREVKLKAAAAEAMRKRGPTVHAATPDLEVAWCKAADATCVRTKLSSRSRPPMLKITPVSSLLLRPLEYAKDVSDRTTVIVSK